MKKILITGGTIFVSRYAAQNKIYPETIPLEEGLKECAEWYVENESEVGKKPYMGYIDCNLK